MNLSEHFTLDELTLTTHRDLLDANRAQAIGVVQDALRALCVTLLEPLRAHFGAPVVVHSGFRCPQLNAVVGGSTSSQHMSGQAADFHVLGVPLEDVWGWVWRTSMLPYGQVILEGYVGGAPSWVHLSLGEPWRPLARCREHFTLTPAT